MTRIEILRSLEKRVKLFCNGAFKDLGRKGEKRDWAVISRKQGVRVLFLEDGKESTMFRAKKCGVKEGSVNEVGEKWCKVANSRSDSRKFDGIQGAVGVWGR